MQYERCEVCGNYYTGEHCTFCHGKKHWNVAKLKPDKCNIYEQTTYHLFSGINFVGTFVEFGFGCAWIPFSGPAVIRHSGDKEFPRDSPLFTARENVQKANRDKDYILDDRPYLPRN